jgi:opacity protein-like surface antigen
MNTKSLLLGAAALLVVDSADAAHSDGWYVGLDAGVNLVRNWEQAIIPSVPLLQVDASYEDGFAPVATVGYRFERDWRVELEGGYRHNEEGLVRLFTVGGSSTFEGDGELSQFSLMANLLYDIPIAETLSLALGAGAGFDHVKFEIPAGSDQDLFWAYQAIVGLNFAMTPSIDVTLNYRYLSVKYDELNLGAGGLRPGADIDQEMFSIGLRLDLQGEEM